MPCLRRAASPSGTVPASRPQGRPGSLSVPMLRIALGAALELIASGALAAVIVGTRSLGPAVTVSSDANGLSATLGRWDTPYDQGLCGPGIAGAEPFSQSFLWVDIDVQEGGVVSFSYEFVTYDNYYFKTTTTDALTIGIGGIGWSKDIAPSITPPIRDCWGDLWTSGRVSCTQSLNQWAHQTVSLILVLTLDGYGDQSQGRISNLAIRDCAEPPLAPLSPIAQAFESDPSRVDIDGMTPSARAALSCFQAAVANAGGSVAVTSAFRPPDYQLHLREVWEKWRALMPNTAPECEALRAQVQNEFFVKHQLGASKMRPAGGAGPHTRGIAFDANVTGVDRDALAAQCGLFRPFPGPCSATARCDTVHFQLR